MAQRVLFTGRGMAGLICCVTAFMLFFIFFTFDPRDPSFFNDIAPFDPSAIVTFGGWWGASLAEVFFRACGTSTFLFCPLLLLMACYLWRFAWADLTRVFGGVCLFFVSLISCGSSTQDPTISGSIGRDLYHLIAPRVGPLFFLVGSTLFCVVGLICLVRFSWASYLHRFFSIIFDWLGVTALCVMIGRGARAAGTFVIQKIVALKEQLLLPGLGAAEPSDGDDVVWEEGWLFGKDDPAPFIPTSIIEISEPEETMSEAYELPLEKLFGGTLAPEREKDRAIPADARTAARLFETKLRQFGIEGSVVSITAGPTVTLFAYAPATDVKVSRIVALEDDLALAIEARSLRVIAPMPGTSYVGFEVANRVSEPVFFGDLVARAPFRDPGLTLPLVLGKNITGDDRIIDLATQPHLLIAGSTGSGKSVALHAMIAGLLSSRSPDELRLVLIDPKRLEFAGYADIAHLLVPIVTEGTGACRVLRFLAKSMEQRYQQMAHAGVRNIQEFHRVNSCAEMPYIVVVIDELADLMMVAGKELDIPLIRLAQMARAAGIHLIVATQRPSVDVLTGLVKVNFPARIAFKVASKTDARTILDQSGAERLLGRGDMLLLDPRGSLERIQGAFVRDEEVRDIVTHIKGQRGTDYLVIPDEQAAGTAGAELDPLFPQIVDFVRTVDEISISLIQRRFRIGYNRSARLVDQLESKGVILPSQGGKMRRVARDSSIT